MGEKRFQLWPITFEFTPGRIRTYPAKSSHSSSYQLRDEKLIARFIFEV
jgi:hypothetical protein